MEFPDNIWIERFNSRILNWATERFRDELASNFARVECFDSPLNREVLSVLRRQPSKQLEILANVLPLGVFGEHPDDLKRRSELPTDEKHAVQTLRNEFDQEHRERFSEHVASYAWRGTDVKEQFNAAVRMGNQMVKQIASQWQCELARAARGEWALVILKDCFRIAVSFDLARNMQLVYRLSISNLTATRTIRFHDSYLGVLGIGASQMSVGTADRFAEKFRTLSEFARWHVREYERLLET